MSKVALENLTKVFRNPGGGEPAAVKDLSLAVEPGELLVMVGPSGSGKTTVLRMIAGLDRATSGKVVLDGNDISDVPASKRDIAMVFQNDALFPHLTVEENLKVGLELRKVPRQESTKRISDVVALLRLEPFLSRYPERLSGGERQRVALGRALVRKPSVFLLDEPLAHLDAPSRAELRQEITKIHREAVPEAAMLYVTHDQAEALAYGARVAVLSQGVLQQVASALEIYRAPANMFVAEFVGSPAMNLIPGHIGEETGRVLFTGPGSFGVDMPERLWKVLKATTRKEVVLGVRAEDICLKFSGKEIGFRILSVELLGSEWMVEVEVGNARIKSRVPLGHLPKPGQFCSLEVNTSHACFFDPASGRNILGSSAHE